VKAAKFFSAVFIVLDDRHHDMLLAKTKIDRITLVIRSDKAKLELQGLTELAFIEISSSIDVVSLLCISRGKERGLVARINVD